MKTVNLLGTWVNRNVQLDSVLNFTKIILTSSGNTVIKKELGTFTTTKLTKVNKQRFYSWNLPIN